MLVKNKVIAVTGGGNGIGREIALLLLEKGAKVAAIDINKDYLDQTAELAGKRTATFPFTLSISRTGKRSRLCRKQSSPNTARSTA